MTELRRKAPKHYRSNFLNGLDQRTVEAQTARTMLAAIESDLGGATCVSTAKRMLISKAVFLNMKLEEMMHAAMNGEPFELTAFTNAVNALTGLLKAIGLTRQSRELTLKDLIGEKAVEHS